MTTTLEQQVEEFEELCTKYDGEGFLERWTGINPREQVRWLTQALQEAEKREREKCIAYTREYDISQITEDELREALT